MYTYMHTLTDTHTHTFTHSHTHTLTHSHAHTHTHTHTHMHTLTHTHTHAHTHSRTHSHKHILTQCHTHTQVYKLSWLKYLVLSARPFLLPKATERGETARHAAATTTTTTTPPESERRWGAQDSNSPSQFPPTDVQKCRFQTAKLPPQWYRSRESSVERQLSAVVLRTLGAAGIQ